MNKTELASEVYRNVKEGDISSKTACERVVNEVVAAMAKGIREDGKLQLVGFGSFDVIERAAREGRNPQTGKPMRIEAKKTVKFKPGNTLLGAVRGV